MQENQPVIAPGSEDSVPGAHYSASLGNRQPEAMDWPAGEAADPFALGGAVAWQVRRPTYNLFRHRTKRDLCCAVPEDRPVPGFLNDDAWFYAGVLPGYSHPPMGFNRSAAELGVRLNGFHLFQVICHRTFATQPAGMD